jgi:hypothetical protein
MTNIISVLLESIRRASHAGPIKNCFLADDEYDAVMRYADEQHGIMPPQHRAALNWHITIAGARIRHLKELVP